MIRPGWLTPAVRGFSRLNDNGIGFMAIGAGVGIARGSARLAFELPAVVATAFALNVLVKQVVRRERPDPSGHLIGAPTSHSFPSSHAATAAAGAVAIGARAPGLAPVLVPTALAIAASRVYLGVHHVSDVTGGLALGALTGAAYATAVR